MTLLQDLRAAIENCRACEHHATADLMERALAEIERLTEALDDADDAAYYAQAYEGDFGQ